MIAFTDEKDGYYQYDWDGISPFPEWAKNLAQCELREVDVPKLDQVLEDTAI